jgi:PAS domain-containing protein
LTSKLPLRDQDGKIVGLVGIGRDITEASRRRRPAGPEERSLLRTLIDNLPDASTPRTPPVGKTWPIPADLKNLRCQTEAEAIGKSDFDLFPKDMAEKFWADDQKVIQGEPVINREEYFLTNRAETLAVDQQAAAARSNGKIVGLVGIGRDITAQSKRKTRCGAARKIAPVHGPAGTQQP